MHNFSRSRVQAVIRAARLRWVMVIAVEQAGFTLAVVFAGAILMLLLGTQILNWYWLMFLTVVAVVISLVRIRARMLTRYRIAQLLDHRLRLSDALSTAWFLLSQPDRRENSLAGFQIEYAGQLASSVEPANAFPFRTHRVWVMAGALSIVLFGLFAVRYLVQSRLNFEESLIPIHLSAALERIENSLSVHNQPTAYAGLPDEEPDRPQPPQSEDNDRRSDMARLHEPSSAQERDPAASDASATHPGTAQESDNPQQTSSGKPESGASSEQQNRSAANRDADAPGNSPTPNAKEEPADSQQSASSLLEKMKDAASSLLAKMRSASNSQNSMQKAQQPSEANKQQENGATSNDRQNQSADARRQQTRSGSSSDGDKQGQTAEKTEASAGRSPDSSNENNGSDSQSGIGRRDGEKALKDAEQLKAMGKLAEIIGRRSASLTGEITVETSSGKQELATQYSHRVGQHSDLGGEINRDEIPLSDQRYVREYMQRVHDQARNQQPR